MSTAITQGIRVTVRSQYLEAESQPRAGKYLFAYTVTISNEGDQEARLLGRHWIITDAHGREEQVRGEGVVGRKPVIAPGQTHEYSSYCPLPTPIGFMRGTFQMVRPDDTEFDATIAPFTLAVPNALN